MNILDQIQVIYDNGGKTLDRYTVFTTTHEHGQYYEALCLSDDPTHPLGFSQFSMGEIGDHCGKKIEFAELPVNVQKHIIQRLTT